MKKALMILGVILLLAVAFVLIAGFFVPKNTIWNKTSRSMHHGIKYGAMLILFSNWKNGAHGLQKIRA